MGGRHDRSHLDGPKDKGGIGRREDMNAGGAAYRIGQGSGK